MQDLADKHQALTQHEEQLQATMTRVEHETSSWQARDAEAQALQRQTQVERDNLQHELSLRLQEFEIAKQSNADLQQALDHEKAERGLDRETCDRQEQELAGMKHAMALCQSENAQLALDLESKGRIQSDLNADNLDLSATRQRLAAENACLQSRLSELESQAKSAEAQNTDLQKQLAESRENAAKDLEADRKSVV